MLNLWQMLCREEAPTLSSLALNAASIATMGSVEDSNSVDDHIVTIDCCDYLSLATRAQGGGQALASLFFWRPKKQKTKFDP